MRYPPIVDLRSQREICDLAGCRAGSVAVKTPPHFKVRLPAEPTWSAGELPPDVWACVTNRGSALHAFELEQNSFKSSDRARTTEIPNAKPGVEMAIANGESLDAPREPPRPPRGAGYVYPGHGGAKPTLAVRLGTFLNKDTFGDGGLASHPKSYDSVVPLSPVRNTCEEEAAEFAWSRKERIAALEDGMVRHEEQKLGFMARGTTPLKGARGEAIFPVPPAEPPKESRLEQNRRIQLLRASKKFGPEEDLRIRMQVEQIMGIDAHERWEAFNLHPELPKVQNFDEFKKSSQKKRSHADLQRFDVKELLQEADLMLREGASEDQWARLASQLCAKAYSAKPREILCMVRTLGSATCSAAGGVAKKTLLQAADHLIQSLTAGLQDENVELLIEVIETMSDARVGSQAYLDMLMALILSRHHRDCRALSGDLSLRLASALGRVSSTLRLRPKGVGGASTFVNWKLMEALEQRIVDRLEECSPSTLAQLDDYYVSRLCGEDARKIIVERMANLELGFRGATAQYLPIMLRLQESLQRELGESFAWSLSREVRNYLSKLRDINLQEQTPWVLGDYSASSSHR